MSLSKILIIDEEYWSIEPAVDRIMSVFGEESFTHCSDGSEGIEVLTKGNFQCIILDIMFPLGEEIDKQIENDDSIDAGLIILKRIREFHKVNTPVICFTIRDDDDVKTEIGKFRNTTHIAKTNPRALEILIIQLKKIIK